VSGLGLLLVACFCEHDIEYYRIIMIEKCLCQIATVSSSNDLKENDRPVVIIRRDYQIFDRNIVELFVQT
jgi:hypothetical protein